LCPFAEECEVNQLFPSANITAEPTTNTEPTMSLTERIAALKAAAEPVTKSVTPLVRAVGINPPDAAPPLPVKPYVPDVASATPVPTPGFPSATTARLMLSVQSSTLSETELIERVRQVLGSEGTVTVSGDRT
jgi:hypothetical protein